MIHVIRFSGMACLMRHIAWTRFWTPAILKKIPINWKLHWEIFLMPTNDCSMRNQSPASMGTTGFPFVPFPLRLHHMLLLSVPLPLPVLALCPLLRECNGRLMLLLSRHPVLLL